MLAHALLAVATGLDYGTHRLGDCQEFLTGPRKGPAVALVRGHELGALDRGLRAEPGPRMTHVTHASSATVALSTEIAAWSSGRRVG
jgi:hypothetical protein